MSNIQLLPQFDGNNCIFATSANSAWLDIIYFTQPGFGAPLQIPACSITSGQNTISVPGTTGLFPGMTISSLSGGIPLGAFIGVVSPSSITMVTNIGGALNATQNNTDVTLVFNPPPLDLTGINFICHWRNQPRIWNGGGFPFPGPFWGWGGAQVFLVAKTSNGTLLCGNSLGTLQFNVPQIQIGQVPPGRYYMDIVALDGLYTINLFQNAPCVVNHNAGISDPSLYP